MPALAGSVVRIERFIAAPAEQAFDAWLDPTSMARWLSPLGHAEADVAPRVGGRLRVAMVADGTRIEHTGIYRELVPHRRLVFTWQSPYTGPDASLVTVELAARDAGTQPLLVHEFLPAETIEPTPVAGGDPRSAHERAGTPGERGRHVSLDVVASMEIARPPEAVAAYEFEPSNDPTWIGGVTSVERQTDGPIGAGSRVLRRPVEDVRG